MELAVTLPYAEGAMTPAEVAEFVEAADRLGYHSVWVAEAWSYDAFMLLTSLAPHTERIGLGTSIVNVYSRTPALIGQSLATLDALSGGRAILGLGASGPQVVEGWHGVPYRKPMQRTRETIEIVRTILRRERLVYDGEIFDLDMGLKLINHPVRSEVPIVVAALGPRNVEMTAELADGWMPTLYSPGRAGEVFGPALEAGRAKRSPDLAPLQVIATTSVGIFDDADAASMAKQLLKHGLALYIGGMGSREQNFYNHLVRRYGYDDIATTVQDLYLDRRRDEAAAAIPDELVDEFAAVGSAAEVKDQLARFDASGVDVLMVQLVAMDQRGRLDLLETLPNLI
ncbi:MAG TPA: LLM class F420-dependent oxidoreductase [Acidimicrobiales bacterium]